MCGFVAPCTQWPLTTARQKIQTLNTEHFPQTRKECNFLLLYGNLDYSIWPVLHNRLTPNVVRYVAAVVMYIVRMRTELLMVWLQCAHIHIHNGANWNDDERHIIFWCISSKMFWENGLGCARPTNWPVQRTPKNARGISQQHKSEIFVIFMAVFLYWMAAICRIRFD